jgi:hypothetical protein
MVAGPALPQPGRKATQPLHTVFFYLGVAVSGGCWAGRAFGSRRPDMKRALRNPGGCASIDQ